MSGNTTGFWPFVSGLTFTYRTETMKTKLRTATIIPYARLQSQGARDYASVSE